MNLYEAIESRFSVRAYKGSVSEEQLGRILNAGRLAPSARNRQAWRFIVVRSAENREALARAAEQPFIAHAPVVLVMVALEPEDRMCCGVLTAPVDCAIALDHMALAAVAEGLGSCWIGHFDQAEVKRVLGVPEKYQVIELMPNGEPSSRPPKKSRKQLEEVVCFERFA